VGGEGERGGRREKRERKRERGGERGGGGKGGGGEGREKATEKKREREGERKRGREEERDRRGREKVRERERERERDPTHLTPPIPEHILHFQPQITHEVVHELRGCITSQQQQQRVAQDCLRAGNIFFYDLKKNLDKTNEPELICYLPIAARRAGLT